MKSGLEGRNNSYRARSRAFFLYVSMKSGLEGRNNVIAASNAAEEASSSQ